MKRSLLLFVLLSFSVAAVADGIPAEGKRLPTWRDRAMGHYYDNLCCYCHRVDAVRSSPVNDSVEYFSLGEWHTMPNSEIMRPDPDKPTQGTIICDPVERKWSCVISDEMG